MKTFEPSLTEKRVERPVSLHRGHQIHETLPGTWVYSDTGKPVAKDPNRPCGHCGRVNTAEGHDGCLGVLPGVVNAERSVEPPH